MVTPQIRCLVINAVISGSGHDIELDNSVRVNTKERTVPSRPVHTVHDPTTGRGPQVKIACEGELKEVDPTSNAVFVAGFRTPEFCSRD